MPCSVSGNVSPSSAPPKPAPRAVKYDYEPSDWYKEVKAACEWQERRERNRRMRFNARGWAIYWPQDAKTYVSTHAPAGKCPPGRCDYVPAEWLEEVAHPLRLRGDSGRRNPVREPGVRPKLGATVVEPLTVDVSGGMRRVDGCLSYLDQHCPPDLSGRWPKGVSVRKQEAICGRVVDELAVSSGKVIDDLEVSNRPQELVTVRKAGDSSVLGVGEVMSRDEAAETQVEQVAVTTPRSANQAIEVTESEECRSTLQADAFVEESSLGDHAGVTQVLSRTDAASESLEDLYVPRDGVSSRGGVVPLSDGANDHLTDVNPPVSMEGAVVGNAAGDLTAPLVAPVTSGPTSVHMRGKLEGRPVRFLVDTGAEISAISFATLAKLPKVIRATFQDHTHTITTVSGEKVPAKGPVLCNISIAGRVVMDAVIAMEMVPEAILSLPTLNALGCHLTVAGVELLPVSNDQAVRRIQSSRVYRVTVAADEVIPACTEKEVLCHIQGRPVGSALVVEGVSLPTGDAVVVARSVADAQGGRTPVRLMNRTESDIRVVAGQYIANATPGEVLTEPVTQKDECQESELPPHVAELFNQTCDRESLPEETRRGLKALLCKHASLFAKDDKDLGRTHIVEHDIDTGDAVPIRQPPRRPPTALQPEMDKIIQDLLSAGVIKRGQSPWASPVVLVRKKDGSIRFCVDYRKLNAVTRFDAYPLPRIDETFESLSGAKYFSTLDLISGYWQVGLTEQAKMKSAFTTRSGLYLWEVMPFGLCNAPSSFERLMETVLQGLQWETCLVYLDDVVCFARTHEEMLARLDDVFTRLRQAGLKLKPRKCHLFALETEYLGHVVSEAGVAMSPEKVRAILEWPVPQCVTDVRSFLGTASYYRRFVRDFSGIAAPLHRLTETGIEWRWADEHQQAFDQLKATLAVAPVLRFPVKDAPYILDTDASNTGIGAVLSQVVDGQERVLGYASRTLSKTERNYCVTRRELLAVIHFVKHFRPYLYGRHFTIRTDHSSLLWLINFKEPEGQLARWIEAIEHYDYEVVHRPGAKHGNADGLSRQPCRQCDRDHPDPRPGRRNARLETVTSQKPSADNMQADADSTNVRLVTIQPRWTAQEFRAAQEADADLAQFLQAFRTQQKPGPEVTSAWSRTARYYLRDWDRMELVDDVLARRWFDVRGQPAHLQWVVPRQLVADVLEQAHANPLAGHMGDKRTRARAAEAFFWYGMGTDARDYCRACQVCCARRPPPTAPHHPVQRQVTTAPLQRVAVDILGPLDPPTSKGNRYVLVIVDYFTKWLTALPMPDMTAETCAERFVREFVCRFGVPEQLHSDRGSQFESSLFQGMCKLLRINKTRTTALHPQSDGQTERAMKSLQDLLAKLARDNRRDWDDWLCFACACYNSSVHRVTGETPNRLMLGREVRTPTTLLAPDVPGQDDAVPWVDRLHKLWRDSYAVVVERTQAVHRAETPWTDRRQKGYSFAEGDQVWCYEPKPKRGWTPKLDANRWTGPWLIIKRISACVYVIQKVGGVKKMVINVDRLAPYHQLREDRFPRTEDADAQPDTDSVADDHSDTSDVDDVSVASARSDVEHTIATDPVREAIDDTDVAPQQPIGIGGRPTRRAQRARRAPTRFAEFDMTWEL